ncbi:UNVERIFIED_ORG: hypothetical protein J2W64_004693 [Rahnella aquatilis]|nr:hypothetical protein [Rahnella aquatilis]
MWLMKTLLTSGCTNQLGAGQAISLWNTVYIERTIDSLKRKGIPLNEQLISHLSPLGWEHINLSGDYLWRTNLKLGQGKYRALRSVKSSLYKKQA